MCRDSWQGNCCNCGAVIKCRDYLSEPCPECVVYGEDLNNQVEPLVDLIERIWLDAAKVAQPRTPRAWSEVFASRIINSEWYDETRGD